MGFLSSMLPTIVGVGVGAATGNPWLGAAAAGGLGYAESGSLQKGLMAGMAGYGGASLGAGLGELGASSMGEQALASQAGKDAMAQKMLEQNMTEEAARSEIMKQAADNASSLQKFGAGLSGATQAGGLNALQMGMTQAGAGGLGSAGLMAASPLVANMMKPNSLSGMPTPSDSDMGQRYAYSPGAATPTPAPDVPSYESGMTQNFGRERRYFTPSYTKISSDQAKQLYGYANGGPIEQPNNTSPNEGTIEQMSDANSVGANTGYPQAAIRQGAYATPWQTPISRNMLETAVDTGVNQYTGEMNFAAGGLSAAASDLGGFSDGGRLLKGPGDGVSDSIPAVIGNKRPARLADGEFVVPARIVSELGNGSTDAGARKLYAMLDRVQKARGKTTGKNKVAANTKADKYLPA